MYQTQISNQYFEEPVPGHAETLEQKTSHFSCIGFTRVLSSSQLTDCYSSYISSSFNLLSI